jgi:6-phosphogluconolactonase
MLYVGTHRRAYRDDPSDIAFGLYIFRGRAGGNFKSAGHVETEQPGWVAVHPSGKFVYVVNEVRKFGGQDGGGVSAFAVDPDSRCLTPLNSRLTPQMPCHCTIDLTGQFLLVATFGGGSVHLFPIAPDGSLGMPADEYWHDGSSVHARQAGPHAHAVVLDPYNRFVLVPDLGIDQVRVYELQTELARLIPQPERTVSLPPGSGPRHLTFDPTGRFAYLMNEISATIAVFVYDHSTGALEPHQTVDLLPTDFAGFRSGAAIAVHPGGRHLYATTRSRVSSGEPPIPGLDNLTWFDVHPENGTLHGGGRMPSGGEIPRSFAFANNGEHLLVGHQGSSTIITFRLDCRTGKPIMTESLDTPVPVCLCVASA